MINWKRKMQLMQRLQRPLATMAVCAIAIIGLQGCVALVAGGAVVGTLAATDRRTFGAQTEDTAIVVKGETRIPKLIGGDGHVNVSSFNRKVLLTGEVKDEATKAAVEHEAAAIEGVQSVANELGIGGASSYTSRSSDSIITTKVKASLVDTKDLYSNAFKIVTERGIVYLMGRVTEREGNLAGEVASGVGGVQKVVKIFEYITEGELKQYSANNSAK